MRKFLFGVFLGTSITMYSQVQVNFSGLMYLNKNESSEGKDATKRGYYIGPHALGDTITMLLNRFENDYVYYKQEDGAYKVEEKKVIKPRLYSAIKKIEKVYMKDLKKGMVEETYVYSKLKLILQRGIKLKLYDTRKVEEELKQIKSVKKMEAYIMALKFH